jgi:low-affinity ferrous iron transport protein
LGHEWTVVGGVVAIFELIVGASAMRWSLIGQLLCNVPPRASVQIFRWLAVCLIGIEKKRDAGVESSYME